MLSLFVRAALVLLLLAISACSVAGVWYLVRPSKAIQVRSFDIIHGAEFKKNEADVLAQLLASRITQIDAVLGTNLSSFTPPDEVRIESVIPPALRLTPDVQSRIEVEFKPLEFDVAGLLNGLLQILHEGPSLRATVMSDEKGVEILASYTEHGRQTLGPWVVDSEKGIGEAVDVLAHSIVLDYHQQHARQLGSLTAAQFISLVSSLKNYQHYVSERNDDVKSGRDPKSNFHLKQAAAQLQTLASQDIACGLVYSYLGSVDTILNDEVGAKANFEKAVALDPADAFSAGELNRWQIASSLKPQSVPGQGSLEAVRNQDALALMHVRQAIHKAGTLTPMAVAVLSTGVSAVGGLTLRKGKTFVGGDPERDVFGHGTQVSSLIAAIAPTAEIVPIKVMNDDGTATSYDIVKGLEYAISTGARIMVLPFGTSEPSQIQEELIAEAKTKGILIVAAAGNNSTSAPTYPAASPGVFSIGATDQKDQRASFSNYGSFVKAAAPGVDILALGPDGQLRKLSGTSFTCAEGAGVAALLWSARPNLSADEVVDILSRSALKLHGTQLGAGRLDALSAVNEAMKL